MIVRETLMPRVAKQTMTFANDACPIVEADEAEVGSTMKAIYREQRAGVEGLVAGEIPRPSPKEVEVLVKVHATPVTPSELEWFTTFNLRFGEPRPFPMPVNSGRASAQSFRSPQPGWLTRVRRTAFDGEKSLCASPSPSHLKMQRAVTHN